MNRMDPEDEAGKPGTGNVQPHQQPPHKQCVCSLQKNINGVIAGCVANKKMMLGPKYGIGNREVICRSSNLTRFLPSPKSFAATGCRLSEENRPTQNLPEEPAGKP